MAKKNLNPYTRTPQEEHDQEVMGQGNNRGSKGRSEAEMRAYAEMFGEPDKPEEANQPNPTEPKGDKPTAEPEDKPVTEPKGDKSEAPNQTPAPEQIPAEEHRETTSPIHSSATLNVAPFADDIQILANELRDGDSMIDSAHDANRIDVRLERIAIQVCAGDEELAARARELAKSYKPVCYTRQSFWFARGEFGRDPLSPAYRTKDEAKASFGKDMLDFLEENGSDTDLLIIAEEGYADADGNYVCSLFDGEPAREDPRIHVSSDLVMHASKYFAKLHDDRTVAPALGDLFVQIVGTDDVRMKRMEAQIVENRKARRPKMKIGFWVLHQNQPSLTREEAEALAYREEMAKLSPRQAQLLRQTGGKLKLPKPKISVYEELPGGRLGKLVPDELANEFMQERGFNPVKK